MMRHPFLSALFVGVLIFAAVVIFLDLGSDQKPNPKPLTIGDSVTLSGHGSACMLAPTREALEKLGNAINAHDQTGLGELMLSGQVYSEPNGTEGIVIDQHADEYQIRLMNGSHAGAAAWTFEPWLKRKD